MMPLAPGTTARKVEQRSGGTARTSSSTSSVRALRPLRRRRCVASNATSRTLISVTRPPERRTLATSVRVSVLDAVAHEGLLERPDHLLVRRPIATK